MSGICGIVFPSGRQIEQAEIDRMLEPLERRGPDGSHSMIDGFTALGHTSLATTPEAVIERLPFTDDTSGCTITADARLDNREDLLARLELTEETRTIGDGELILLAYLKWGAECPGHLIGDFAFAIWDPRDERIFCARDQVGMRQLVYTHRPGEIFAFATEPRALLRCPGVPFAVNEGRIGDFFEGLEAHDLTSTFFDGIDRLPPAHALIVDREGLRSWKYWQLKVPPILQLPDDEAYAAGFLEVFTEAVRVRLRSPAAVGSMLSGGMDSGSVAAVAAQLLKQAGQPPLKTYSAIRDDAACVESRTIRSALAIEHIDPSLVSLDDLEGYRDDLERLTRKCDEPFDGHMTLLRAVYLRAHDEGIKVMLDGVGGDTTLASENMVSRYLRLGKVRQAWREAAGERRFWGVGAGAWTSFARGLARRLVPEALLKRRRARLTDRKHKDAEAHSPISAEFAERIDMAARRAENAVHVAKPSDPDARKVKRVLHPYVVVARERYDRTASALGIEPRDPFLDIRVLEFCLSLPQEQLQKDGWPKIILRRAMDGLLPDKVRWRVGKEHLGWEFTQALWPDRIEPIQGPDMQRLRSYLKPRTLHLEPSQVSDESLESHLASIYLCNWWAMTDTIQSQDRSHDQFSRKGRGKGPVF